MRSKKTNFALFCALFFITVSVSAQNEPQDLVKRRAGEIKFFLTAQPLCVGKPITDRVLWEKLAQEPTAKNIVRNAENLKEQPIPELPESLYKEFYRNGNRVNYQNARTRKFSRLSQLALAECFENKGRFIAPLEEIIRSVCDEPSWLLPAHDNGGLIYDGKDNYIDLASSDTSAELALIDYCLGDKLSPEIRRLIRDNVQRRTFASYESTALEHLAKKGKKNWWISCTNNWNAVCHANVVCAAAALIESPQKRAWYIASAEYFMTPFFDGFTPDGYCSEGMGYWNYGFGHFVELAEIVEQVTDGKVDFFQMPSAKNCALFAPRMEAAPGQFAAFADCSITARPDPTLAKFLSKRLQWGYENYENVPSRLGNLKATAVYCFPNSADKQPKGKSAATPLNELRTLFPDAGIFIGRNSTASPSLSFVCKAGHNAEHHNHNDVGSFTVMYAGRMPVLDPGGEVYTQRTFSGQRYESKLLNSYGHPVPVINGQLQKTGRKSEGKILSQEFSDEKDTLMMDIAPAYGLKEIKTLNRQFEFLRSQNALIVQDTVALTAPGTFETALETYEPFQVQPSMSGKVSILFGTKEDDILVTVEATRSDNGTSGEDQTIPLELRTEEIDEDAMARKKPTRLSFKIKDTIQNATVRMVIQRNEAKQRVL